MFKIVGESFLLVPYQGLVKKRLCISKPVKLNKVCNLVKNINCLNARIFLLQLNEINSSDCYDFTTLTFSFFIWYTLLIKVGLLRIISFIVSVQSFCLRKLFIEKFQYNSQNTTF